MMGCLSVYKNGWELMESICIYCFCMLSKKVIEIDIMVSLSFILLASVGILLANVQDIQAAITVQQMMDAAKLMRQSCQPKFKVSDEIADGIRDGKMPDTKDIKCYINCILEMTKSVKKGKYQLELGLKQVDLMVPDELKDEYKNALNTCKDAGNGFKAPCDVSYEILKCFYKNAPRFVFP